MAEQQPNDASRKSKAEGERLSGAGQEEQRMMNRDRRSSSNDPTAERTVAQSTQSASGLSGGTDRQRRRDDRERLTRASLDTPRRYDQPIEDDDDPVMPSDDATVNTKI